MDFTTNNHLKLAELMRLCQLEFMIRQFQNQDKLRDVPPGFEEPDELIKDDTTTIR